MAKGKHAEAWNLVAAGPSRANLQPEDFLDGPVVTVNCAIDIAAQGHRVDIAAISDGPSGCWEAYGLEEHWTPGVLLWVSTRVLTGRQRVTNERGEMEDKFVPGPPLLAIWDQRLPASIGFRLMPHVMLEDTNDPPGNHRVGFTTLCAFMGILRYSPKKIRILSMDMAGSWIKGKTEEECLERDMKRMNINRWRHERIHMDRAITEARKQGVVVEEWRPK